MVKGRILRVQSSVEVSPVASVTVRVKPRPGRIVRQSRPHDAGGGVGRPPGG
jgi:hypothetical protein